MIPYTLTAKALEWLARADRLRQVAEERSEKNRIARDQETTEILAKYLEENTSE